MMVVVTETAEVVQRNHLEVRTHQCSGAFLSNSLQDARTCFLLNTDRERELSV